ncbi:F-box only protein 25-like isoform X1 [Haliotis cracherodii]|uniref:F-box only protein 25-like isoform X1 n=2 Tax=Haliotis rufescens TaxID=6454 RepID=UPI001EAF9A45|nr:F-box only protein 25-like isoform X1 [Haliotis rufescens]
MPFLGRDWRSPGDEWVRTASGWERLKLWRLKVFENLNENVIARLIRLALVDTSQRDVMERRQPFIQYHRGTSKERKELTSISEAFIRLDMTGAVKDIRRFNYVCKVLHLILGSKLSGLSGTAQKQVINILEATSEQVLKTEYSLSTLRELLKSADLALQQGKTSHIGSARLWMLHQQKVTKMNSKVDAYKMTERECDGKLTMMDLPEDCIRGILSCLADHKDILHTSQTSQTVYELSQEAQLWKQLCFFHFTDKQLVTFLPVAIHQPTIDWKYIYRRCYKRFGKKDSYADMLALCVHCNNIFWQSLGHPCYSEEPPASTPLNPEEFLKLFSL